MEPMDRYDFTVDLLMQTEVEGCGCDGAAVVEPAWKAVNRFGTDSFT
jgi:hypothetical protein